MKHFEDGKPDIADHPCCSQLRSVITEQNEQKVEALIKED